MAPEDAGAPELSAEDSLKTIVVPPGYRVELVAKEPLVEDPILIDFDADGRMWVVEMPAFAMGEGMRDSREGICRVVVLEDLDDDGTMDRRTVFADKLVLPRAIKTLATGVLVGEPPHLWWMRDTNGDLRMDEKALVSDTFGRLEGNPEHNANSLIWGLDNWVYTSEHDWHLRFRDGRFEVDADAQPRASGAAPSTTPGASTATSTARRSSWTSRPPAISCGTRTSCRRAASTRR